jgi:homocysteine S-methyltransferase
VNLLEELETQVVCGDGAMGTLLFARGLPVESIEKIVFASIEGANCLNGPRAMVQVFEGLPAGDLLAAYPNAGYPRYTEGRYVYPTEPNSFATAAREIAAQGVRLIGGCCGTTPAHIAAVAQALREFRPPWSKMCLVS